MITVFTPAYNRAYIISQLFNSLQAQSSKDFEWIVVDDGSSDNIDDLMTEFIRVASFPIRYFKQPNGGKHRAINRGVREAKGDLFFIVDSDDYLTHDAIEWINSQWQNISDKTSFCGISGIRSHSDGSPISTGFNDNPIVGSVFDIRYKHHIIGDLAEVFRTDLLLRFPFPEFENEKFVPEALIWNRLGRDGLLLKVFNKSTYICEYLSDGLTASITKARLRSPVAATLFYKELFETSFLPFKIRFKAAINYFRFLKNIPLNKRNYEISGFWRFIAAPIGFLMHRKDIK